MADKLIITYDANHGYLFPDGRTEEWVDKIIDMFHKKLEADKADGFEDIQWNIKVCSELIVHFFRLRAVEGKIEPDKIEFRFGEEVVGLNEYGRIDNWPKGFCDIAGNTLFQIIDGANRKRNKVLDENLVEIQNRRAKD